MVRGPVVAALAPQPENDVVGVVVRDAQDRLRRASQVANLGSDPLGTVIEAQINLIGALHTLFEDLKTSVSSQTLPITDDVLKETAHAVATKYTPELIRATDRLLARRQRRFQVKTVLISVAAASIVAGGLVYLSRPPETTCLDTLKGGRFCGVWTIPEQVK